MSRKVEFFDEIYRFQWLAILGGTVQEALDYFAERIGEEKYKFDGTPDAHFSAFRPRKLGCLWFKDTQALRRLGAHECFHGTMYLFETLTMKGPVEETEEVFAYYMQWLLNLVNRELSKTKQVGSTKKRTK